MEFAGSPFEIKQLSDSGHIEGVLAGFGNVDHGGDKLLPGCLTKTLAGRLNPLPMLLFHDMRRPIGAWKEWQERPEGLYVKGTMTLATRDAQEALALAKDGAIAGLSIGWKATKSDFDSKGVRVVAEAELFEGSLVAVPMNSASRITSLKNLSGPREIAELLKDAGLSGRQAKAAAGAAWKAMNDQTEDGEIAEIARLFEQHSARIAGA